MWQYNYTDYNNDFLAHHGIKGQKWGIRRYQNEDGSLTPEGQRRYGSDTTSYKKVSELRSIKSDTKEKMRSQKAEYKSASKENKKSAKEEYKKTKKEYKDAKRMLSKEIYKDNEQYLKETTLAQRRADDILYGRHAVSAIMNTNKGVTVKDARRTALLEAGMAAVAGYLAG